MVSFYTSTICPFSIELPWNLCQNLSVGPFLDYTQLIYEYSLPLAQCPYQISDSGVPYFLSSFMWALQGPPWPQEESRGLSLGPPEINVLSYKNGDFYKGQGEDSREFYLSKRSELVNGRPRLRQILEAQSLGVPSIRTVVTEQKKCKLEKKPLWAKQVKIISSLSWTTNQAG